MKLAISLLVLAAFGQATSQTLATDQEYLSSPNIKRELLEGNFGDRTGYLHRYGAADTTPGIQYLEDDQSTPHNPIFGARLPPIAKISDLLTGHGPSFEVALANHLYSPVSVYNTKPTSPGLFQVSFPEKSKKSSTKSSKKQKKVKSSEDADQKFTDYVTKQSSFYPTDDYPSTPEYSSRDRFVLPPSLGGEEFSHHKSLPGHVFLRYDDKSALKFTSKHSTQNPPLHYYQHQPVIQFVPKTPYYQYYNQEQRQEAGDSDKKEENTQKQETTGRPEYQPQYPIYKPGYYSHPNGAVSYASYTSNQGPEQPKYQLQYAQTTDAQPQTYAPHVRYQQPIYVPEYVYTSERPDAQKAASPEPQQQYAHVPQQQYVQAPGVQQSSPAEKQSEPTYVPVPQQQYTELYLNPARHQLLHDLQQSQAAQPVHHQQQYVYVTPQPVVVQPTTPVPQHYESPQPVHYPEAPQQVYYPPQSPQQDVVHILPQQRYTPAPYGHSATPQNSASTSSAPQYSATPKPQPQPNQVLQATTLEPEILNENPRSSEAHPRSLNAKHAPQPTSSINSSPDTLQSLSTSSSTAPTPQAQYSPAHGQGVQIQQQELQELHSDLQPLLQEHKQANKAEPQGTNYYGSTLPGEYQGLSTPQPTEPTRPDYEIEISTNIDHNQLPKDLQPKNSVEQSQHKGEHQEQSQPKQSESQGEQSQSQAQNTQPKEQPQQPNSQQQAYPQQELSQPQYHPQIPIPHNEVPVAINPYDPNVPYLAPVLTPVQPILQPQIYSNGHDFVVQSHFPPQPAPTLRPLQFFGKFAESLFGGR